MSIVPETIICDECSKRRDSDVNHWLSLGSVGTRDIFFIFTAAQNDFGSKDRHACGIECAIKLLSRWFEENRR